MKHIAIISITLLIGCSCARYRPYVPDLSVHYSKAEDGYKFMIVNYANQDIFVIRTLVKVSLIHTLDDFGVPTDDTTDTHFIPQFRTYCHLTSASRNKEGLTASQGMSIFIPFTELDIDKNVSRKVEQVRVTLITCPVLCRAKNNNEWLESHVFSEIIATPIKAPSGEGVRVPGCCKGIISNH